jgi:hypothetical protein
LWKGTNEIKCDIQGMEIVRAQPAVLSQLSIYVMYGDQYKVVLQQQQRRNRFINSEKRDEDVSSSSSSSYGSGKASALKVDPSSLLIEVGEGSSSDDHKPQPQQRQRLLQFFRVDGSYRGNVKPLTFTSICYLFGVTHDDALGVSDN